MECALGNATDEEGGGIGCLPLVLDFWKRQTYLHGVPLVHCTWDFLQMRPLLGGFAFGSEGYFYGRTGS